MSKLARLFTTFFEVEKEEISPLKKTEKMVESPLLTTFSRVVEEELSPFIERVVMRPFGLTALTLELLYFLEMPKETEEAITLFFLIGFFLFLELLALFFGWTTSNKD